MKAFITKYALTSGIKEVEGEIVENIPTMFKVPNEIFGTYHGEGKQWHRTRQAAIAKAEQMRNAKRMALLRQLDKLDRMKFL